MRWGGEGGFLPADRDVAPAPHVAYTSLDEEGLEVVFNPRSRDALLSIVTVLAMPAEAPCSVLADSEAVELGEAERSP